MRKLDIINNDLDIYQPVSSDDLKHVENELTIIFPKSLTDIYKHPDLRLLNKLPTLLWLVHNDSIGLLEINYALHHYDYHPFPPNLIAFATNECGDFWVINKLDYSILYIDPDKSVNENLLDKELYYHTFDDWLKSRIDKKKCRL